MQNGQSEALDEPISRPPTPTHPVGIDDLNIYGSTLAVSVADIAATRRIPEKNFEAVQFFRRSVTPPYEDPVTLGVNAAKPIVDSAGGADFELLIVASESGLDYGKPLSSYIHRYLGLDSRCRNFEIKHACYAGTAALQLACSWARSDASGSKKALVIMTDLPRCHFNDPAELTAGAGAVAVSVARDPRVLEIEQRSGFACKEIYDVARPTATSEWGDAVLSLGAYLDLLEMAWESYQASFRADLVIEEHFRYLLYHTPLVSLIEQAHQVLLEAAEPDRSPDEIRSSFSRMVRPALCYAQELANIYSGSLYALLAGLIDSVSDMTAGTRIGMFSYGSGSAAELFAGLLRPSARRTLIPHRIGEHLAARRTLSVDTYEALVRETTRCLISQDYRPDHGVVPHHFDEFYRDRQLLVLQSVENYYRKYSWS
jgi:3-hydroxy-3-methylglutaryl CoA synthase